MIESVCREVRSPGRAAAVVVFLICAILAACGADTPSSSGSPSGTTPSVDDSGHGTSGVEPAAAPSAVEEPEPGPGDGAQPAGDAGKEAETETRTAPGDASEPDDQAPSKQQISKPSEGPVGPPAPNRTQQPPPVVTTPIADIQDYRADGMLFVARADGQPSLDLSHVNFEAPVLARVGGRTLTQDEFRKRAILLLGGAEIDQYITYVLTKRRLDQLLAEGADPELYTVSDEEVQRSIEEKKKIAPQVMRRSGEEWEKQIREQFGWERFLEVEKANLGFSKVFLPPILSKEDREKGTGKGVTELPSYTADLLEPAMAGTLKRYYSDGTPIPVIFQSTFVQQIRTALLKSCHITYWFEKEIDPAWLLVLEEEKPAAAGAQATESDGASFEPVAAKVDDIWVLLQTRLKPGDLELALRDSIVAMAVDQALENEGFLLSADEREASFKKHEKVYEGTLFPLQLVASLKGFGSLHKYREYYGRKAGFEQYLRMQHPGAAWDKALMDHFSSGPSRLFFNNGRIATDVIWIAAWDRAAGGPKEGGLEAAIRRANEQLERLHKGENFLALLDEVSELPNSAKINRGRYGVKSRYELRQALGETEYSIFANAGYCLADDLFYNAADGEIIGPVVRGFPERGKGAFIVRVDHFEQKPADRGFAEQKELIQSDYIDLNYQKFVVDAVRAAQVELTNRGSGE